jgi:pyruvate kinase
MLSGETANGKHASLVVATMGALLANAELAVDYKEQYHAIRCGMLHDTNVMLWLLYDRIT